MGPLSIISSLSANGPSQIQNDRKIPEAGRSRNVDRNEKTGEKVKIPNSYMDPFFSGCGDLESSAGIGWNNNAPDFNKYEAVDFSLKANANGQYVMKVALERGGFIPGWSVSINLSTGKMNYVDFGPSSTVPNPNNCTSEELVEYENHIKKMISGIENIKSKIKLDELQQYVDFLQKANDAIEELRNK